MGNELEEIKARIDVAELIQEYIKLIPAGQNFKACCPFHNEKTPSFVVSPEKQIWHCFGCGAGGDIFEFIKRIESVEFVEALKILASKAGVSLRRQNPTKQNQKMRLFEICETASQYWQRKLMQSKDAQFVREYLKNRQINSELAQEFKLGYALDSWDDLINFLREKKYSEDEIFSAGLSARKEGASRTYDRFRNRLMFPISDHHGQVVGFTGRIMKEEDGVGKYLNTSQTLIYNKSLILFNLDRAKHFIKKEKLAVIVEGQMDVIASWKAGVKNVVASSGTALTSEQVRLLKRYSNNFALSFDADLAGQNAAQRGIDVALSHGVDVKVIRLPFGKDPDECIQQDIDAWAKATKNSESVMDYYFTQTFFKFDINKIDDKKQVAKILLTAIKKLTDPIEKNHWLKQLASKLSVPEIVLQEALDSLSLKTQKIYTPTSSQQNNQKSANLVKSDKSLILSEMILGLMLKFPEYIDYVIDHLTPEILVGDNLQKLYKRLVVYYTSKCETADSDKSFSGDFYVYLEREAPEILKFARVSLLRLETESSDLDDEDVKSEAMNIINSLKQVYKKAEQKKIVEEIEVAEKAGDMSLANSLLKKYQSLSIED